MRLGQMGLAVAVAGTLDLAAAAVMTVMHDRPIMTMLRGIASGPFGRWALDAGAAGPAMGVAVHFAIMASMVGLLAVLMGRFPAFSQNMVVTGILYGTALYLVMYWVVLPMRWPAHYPEVGMQAILTSLAIHILLVGIPIAMILARSPGRQ